MGQRRPCNVVLRNLTAERNAIGYYGTNASGGVIVMSSVFRGNRLGIAPNSQDMEKLAPQADAVIVGNLVADNDDPMTSRIPSGYFGGGIAIGGGTRNPVLRNRVTGHDRAGIELLDLDDYRPEGNRIEGNVLSDNAVDLVYAVAGAVDGGGNCFVGNTFTSGSPARLHEVLPCDGEAQPFTLAASPTLAEPPSVDFRTVTVPPPQPTMPQDQRGPSAGAGMRWRAALVGVLVLVAACGGGGSPATTVPTGPQPLNDDQAARLAQSGFLNAQLGGARFEANSAFLVGEPRETVSLVGEVDWKRHVGRALVRINGADASLTEVYWERDVLLERRPAMDVLVAARGGPEQAWIARSPDPSGRHVDRLVALVMALASEQPDNALLIQQTEGSSFIRADELRGPQLRSCATAPGTCTGWPPPTAT